MATSYPKTVGSFIAGQWKSAPQDRCAIIDPASGGQVGDLELVSKADLDEALDAADRGFRSWRDVAPQMRHDVLSAASALIRERAEDIAHLVTIEEGKPLVEARGEVLSAAALTQFHASESLRVYGRVLMRPTGTRSMVLHEPVGPVAAFCAWNFPALNVARKLAPAIAAGCSIILKPSEETPASAAAILQCFIDAGLPGDVAQIVFGDPDTISRQLLASPITRKLSFTGSVPVGKHLAALASASVMKMTLELGGHAPVLVFADCQLDAALDKLVSHKFRNAGQVCVSPTRFFVHQDIYDQFCEGFAQRAAAIRLGIGLDPATQMGPLANTRRRESIASLVNDARSRGARILAGGNAGDNGFGFAPTVIGDAPADARAMSEEPFGPVALIAPFADDDEAIANANRLPFGLAAYCFTESGRRQNVLADRVEAGMVAINDVRLSWPDSPFNGLKESGYGSEDGPEGVAAHMVTKAVHIS